MPQPDGAAPGPLHGLRVIDLSTVIAGPACARYLADFGADVVKVEHPDGDGLRNMGWRDPADDESLFWKLEGRGKRTIALDLKDEGDRATFRRLVDRAHVLVENFRPGTLERLGFGPDVLHTTNPGLVITRVTGFGQEGPYSGRPGFATIAEAMSGFAAINGEAGGHPLLPPIALTDEVTGLVAALSTMVALHAGVGQVVDVNLLESIFQIMGPLIGAYRMLGYEQQRMGSGIPYVVPRGTYQCSDGLWVAISTSSDSVAQRLLALIGRAGDERFATFSGRTDHREELDEAVSAWCAARTRDQVLAEVAEAHAAGGPVLTMADISADPHYEARGSIVEVDGVTMQGLAARFSATPGRIRWAGHARDADRASILAELDALDRADEGGPTG